MQNCLGTGTVNVYYKTREGSRSGTSVNKQQGWLHSSAHFTERTIRIFHSLKGCELAF